MTPQQIKQTRYSLGMSQSQMSRALGLTSVMTYAKWEQGSSVPSASAVASIKMLLFIAGQGAMEAWLSSKP